VFAELFHVNEADANMAKIPESVPDDMAVYCADMLSTGFMGAESQRVDPTLMTTHTFKFDDLERAFEVSDKKLDDVIKALIVF
jgi:threonine dehydrogenase-like Zn-dependent dehydrogenase